jgi:hypothetical protein
MNFSIELVWFVGFGTIRILPIVYFASSFIENFHLVFNIVEIFLYLWQL